MNRLSKAKFCPSTVTCIKLETSWRPTMTLRAPLASSSLAANITSICRRCYSGVGYLGSLKPAPGSNQKVSLSLIQYDADLQVLTVALMTCRKRESVEVTVQARVTPQDEETRARTLALAGHIHASKEGRRLSLWPSPNEVSMPLRQ